MNNAFLMKLRDKRSDREREPENGGEHDFPEKEKEYESPLNGVPPTSFAHEAPSQEPKKPRPRRWAGVLFFIFLFGFGWYTFFPSVVVKIIPRVEQKILSSEVFSAKKPAAGDDLAFEFVQVSDEETRAIPATGVEQVDEKASGKITIFNEYSEKVQRFVKNTRFESPKGKIYRIAESVDIPGMKKSENDIVPGKVTVTVYADSPGEEYNLPDTKTFFTVPGLKDSPMFKGFYAESITPIVGGFSA